MMTQSATAKCQEKGHIDCIWIQDSLLSVPSAENLFQYKHFHKKFKVDSCTCAKARHCLVKWSVHNLILTNSITPVYI